MSGLKELTLKDLRSIAKESGYRGYSKLTKYELLSVLFSVSFRMKSGIKSKQLTEDGGVEDLDELTDEGLPFFRKYIQDDVELKIASILMENPHPNIVKIYKIGPDYIDMELLKTNFGVSEIKAQMVGLTKAKEKMQSLGIAYVDWKKDNIGMDINGVLKVFDFDMSSIFKNSSWLAVPKYKCGSWRVAENNGMKSPREVDNWIFERAF